MKKILRRLGLLALHVGIDLRRIIALRHFWRYTKQVSKFRKSGGVISRFQPILIDFSDQAGTAKGHYFHQDLLVASLIALDKPDRHIDIGSRVDGFVAHVASFRKIEVMDIRVLENVGHENICFIKADLMSEASVVAYSADSISCLHAIEHFGLGRYGDPIDPEGHINGLRNILKMLKPGGMLYMSFPIGNRTEVVFNAHRVFSPKSIFEWLPTDSCLRLIRFDYVDDDGILHRKCDIDKEAFDLEYGCGIYSFQKQCI